MVNLIHGTFGNYHHQLSLNKTYLRSTMGRAGPRYSV